MQFDVTMISEYDRKSVNNCDELKRNRKVYGKKTLGKSPLSGVEQKFTDFCRENGWRVLYKEPFALYVLNGGVYTPDFMIDAGQLVLVECKSYDALPGEEKAKARFVDASKRNPQVEFWWARNEYYKRGYGFMIEKWRGGCEIFA